MTAVTIVMTVLATGLGAFAYGLTMALRKVADVLALISEDLKEGIEC